MDKVSIVITTYKRFDRIEMAIKSALNQTYKNTEIIVVDDNLPNSDERKKTRDIVLKYPNVIYVENEKNLGGAESRNVGIHKATGKFIAFLDDDDVFHKDKVEKQVNLYNSLDNPNCCLIYCYYNRVDANGKVLSVVKKDFEGKQLYNHMKYGLALTSSWLCPRDILLKVGGFDDVPCIQEGTLLLKMLVAGYEVYRVPEPLFDFLAHSITNGSGITHVSEKYIKGKMLYMDKCRSHFNLIGDKKKIKNIEYRFDLELYNLYCYIKDRKMMRKYLKKIIAAKPFNIETFKSVFKFCFLRFFLYLASKA